MDDRHLACKFLEDIEVSAIGGLGDSVDVCDLVGCEELFLRDPLEDLIEKTLDEVPPDTETDCVKPVAVSVSNVNQFQVVTGGLAVEEQIAEAGVRRTETGNHLAVDVGLEGRAPCSADFEYKPFLVFES